MLHPPNVVLPPLGSVPVSIDPHYNPPWAAASSLQAQIDALTMAEDVRRYQDMHRLATQAHAGILDELNGLKRTLPELLQHAQMARLAAELGDHDRAAVERLSEIGRAHVCTPVHNAHLVCRLLLETKNKPT